MIPERGSDGSIIHDAHGGVKLIEQLVLGFVSQSTGDAVTCPLDEKAAATIAKMLLDGEMPKQSLFVPESKLVVPGRG